MKIYDGRYMKNAFTIVELLVVIVVIGILAAITIVSYSGVQNKAVSAMLQSDLDSNSKILKMYNVEYGSYPSAIDTSYCPTAPNIDARYCMKVSSDIVLSYVGGGQSFKISVTKGGMTYFITESSAVTLSSVPILSNNTSASVTSTTAKLGATVVSDSGSSLLDAGICWGVSPNPTNCQSGVANNGPLTTLATPTIAAGSTPSELVISSDGKSAYAANRGSNYLSMYSRDVATGILAAISTPTIATGTMPSGLVISPDGTSVYAANRTSNTISMYSRDISTGILAALSTPTVATNTTPTFMAISADGKSVYVTNYGSGNITFFARNTTTGILAPQSAYTTGVKPSSVAVSSDGKSVYVANETPNTLSMFSRSVTNGQLTALTIPTIATGASPRGVVVSPDGASVYVTNSLSNTVSMYSRNTGTGALNALSTAQISTGTNPTNVIVSPDNMSVYVSNMYSNNISLYSRDISTGALTTLSTATVATGSYPWGMAVSPDGTFFYVANSGEAKVSMLSRFKFIYSVGVAYNQPVAGLTASTTVHYRGYATNANGTGYSSDSTFTTP